MDKCNYRTKSRSKPLTTKGLLHLVIIFRQNVTGGSCLKKAPRLSMEQNLRLHQPETFIIIHIIYLNNSFTSQVYNQCYARV